MALPKTLLNDLGFASATIRSLHTGISETFLAENPNGQKIIIKELRETRDGDQTPHSEMAWLSALAAQDTPCVQPYFPDAAATSVVINDTVYSFYRYAAGDELDRAVLDNYETAGRLLRKLHDAGQTVDHTANAVLQQRPVYDVTRLVRQFYPVIAASDLFSDPVKASLLQMGRDIENQFPRDRIFIHGDYHFGNLLQSGDAMTILDFDECGFGSRYYDIGTMLLHTMAGNNPLAWDLFLKGYGSDDLDDNDLKYGAAARIFYLIGTVPSRFHVPDVANDAVGIIERYTNKHLTNVMQDQYF